MDNKTSISPRQGSVNRFFLAAKVGGTAWAISFVFYLALLASGLGQESPWIWLNYAVFIVFFIALILQFRARDADEFTSESWHSASSTAFIVTVGWMLFGSQIEAAVNWLYFAATGEAVRTGYAFFAAFQVPMITFYAVFFYRHLRDN